MSQLNPVISRDHKLYYICLQAVYMFLALAIVCDDYFVTSLEKICEVSGFVTAFSPNTNSKEMILNTYPAEN